MDYLEKSKNLLAFFLVSSFLLFFANKIYSQECRRGFLESPIFDAKRSISLVKFMWRGNLESFTNVNFEILSTDNLNKQKSEWNYTLVDIVPGEFHILKDGHKNVRYVQYRILLQSCDDFTVPRIDRVFIYYTY